MMRHPCHRLARVFAAALSTAPFAAVVAHAETLSGIGVSANAAYASNPYLLTGADTGAASAQVRISPFVEEKTARSSLRVATDVGFTTYSRRYRNAVDLSANADYRNALSRQVSIRAGVSLNSSVGGGYNVAPIFAAAPEIPGVTPSIIDLTGIGFQERSTQAQGRAGLSYLINDKNSISVDLDGSVVQYPAILNRAEYSSLSQTVGYTRTLNPRMSVGAAVSVNEIDYRGGRLGDSVVVSPSINGSMRLNSRWTLSAGIGVSSARINVPTGRFTSTNLSGNLAFCRTDTRTTACLNALRSTSASSFDGPRTTTSVGASYSYRLTSRDTFSASGGYSQSKVEAQFAGTSPSIDYLSGTMSFSRRFSDQLSGIATAGYARSGFNVARSNTFGSLGISYNFGRR